MVPPKAKQIPFLLKKHEHTRVDNYFWLNDRENSEVLEYLQKEQEYSNWWLQSEVNEIEQLQSEFLERIVKKKETVPYLLNGYYYYYSYTEDSDYPVFNRSKTNKIDLQNDECVVDIQSLSIGKKFCSVSKVTISKDTKQLVYSLDLIGRRQYDLYSKNLDTNKVVLLPTGQKVTGNVLWCTDNETVLYNVSNPQTLRAYQVWSLNIHTFEKKLIYEETDPTFRLTIYKNSFDSALFIASVSTLATEIRICNSSNPSENNIIFPRKDGIEYYAYLTHNGLFVYTNYKAKNFKLLQLLSSEFSSSFEKAEQEKNIVEILPHNENIKLENVQFFQDFYIFQERSDGTEQIYIGYYNSSVKVHIQIPEKEYSFHEANNEEYAAKTFRFGITTLRAPFTTYEFTPDSKKLQILKEEPLAIPYNKDNYQTYRIYANAKDKMQIPITIVHKKGIIFDGSNPLLLYGYGSYGITIDPNFSSERLSLLDRGFIYAIAHIRGEQFFGREWYEDGKLLNKMNTFTDFIACAEELISRRYTSNTKLIAQGGSAGGLLMGAVANLRPDLFAGIVTLVPFVDVVTTMLDDTIPLTTSEYDEWGNPNDQTFYEYMLSYSPYDNIQKKEYPPMLVVTGYHDSQVQYWEPAKYVAKLRELKTDSNPLLFQINFEAGHGGASGRFKSLKETARNFAFILHCIK